MRTVARTCLPAIGAVLLGLALAAPVQAADNPDKGARRTIQPVPATPPKQARVAQGGVVMLAPSKLSQAELGTLRPNYRALIPRIGNP